MKIQGFASCKDKGLYDTAISRYEYGADCDVGEEPICILELEMLKIMAAIKQKPCWWEKVLEEEISMKWEQEARNLISESIQCRDKLLKYVFKELDWQAKHYFELNETKGVIGKTFPAAVEGVFAGSVGDDLLIKFKQEIKLVRNRPAIGSKHIDRHPRSENVIDLVHPSLYCYMHGVSRVLEGKGAELMATPYLGTKNWAGLIGKGESSAPKLDRSTNGLAEFESDLGLHWLPTEFYVNEAATECKINSYINCLHPQADEQLYKSLSELFLKCLPGLEYTLTELNRPEKRRLNTDHNWWSDPDPNLFTSLQSTEDRTDMNETMSDEFRVFVEPEVPEFRESISLDHEVTSLRERPLQVMVKIASLELEEQEAFDGGSWHVEGVYEERIVATACCYLETENISGGDLEFRISVREPDYEQSDDRGVELMYGLEDDKALVQHIGKCGTEKEGKILCWPNTYQHRVQPVKLVDNTKPGKRTICCFFLVDPTLRIRSTATVPPQQREWLVKEIASIFNNLGFTEKNLQEHIFDYAFSSKEFLTYEEACKRRELLMNERKAIFAEDKNDPYEAFFTRSFSLCEH